MSEPVRCLSVRQPYAWAICAGVKDVENRGWTTKYRGRIAIHAGLYDGDIVEIYREVPELHDLPEVFTFGQIIGFADLVDVVQYSDDLADNPWAGGPYCWLLENAQLLKEPVPSRGRQSLYRLPEEVSRQLEQAEIAPLTEGDREWCEILHEAASGDFDEEEAFEDE
ncbi:ASCH domain-containing protein [Lignipirellula cremea]|uniref:Uncharacterized protein n=1 Tax=Lignipirellula cremea TaxID=2528010 RepID=A0A518DSA2_9BACT|nr:ASCH domain-containing protein [Lignipirellula cremea]QDU94723.1 hypothetical protein Pla8534_25290 [Lignipirellula cremea]